jgi:hydrogenase/urease accessory protein HupE
MLTLGVFAGLAILLFAGAFVSKRRFGLLGLALTAGATLSTIWSYDAGLVISSTGLVPDGEITTAVTLSLIVLLPAIVLLFHGYAYKSVFGRVIGALLFTCLALAFLLQPVSLALPQEATVEIIKDNYRDVIISVGVVFAVIDLFFTKPKILEKEKKH